MTGSRSCIYDLQIWVKSVARQPHSWPGPVESQNPWIGGDLAASEMMRKKTGESWSFGLPPLGIQDISGCCSFESGICDTTCRSLPKSHKSSPTNPNARWHVDDVESILTKKRNGAAIGRCGIEGRCENLPVKGEENIIEHPRIFWVCLNMLVMNHIGQHTSCVAMHEEAVVAGGEFATVWPY